MPVLMILEVPGGTIAQYEKTNEILGVMSDDTAPDGLISHACGEVDGGILVVDLWQSEGALNTFVTTRLRAALTAAGMPEAHPRIVPTHNTIRGAA